MRTPLTRNLVAAMLCVAAALGTGCATPVGYTEKPLQVYDKDTTYRIDDSDTGFTVVVYYSRYQFVPESDVVAAAGRSALMGIARDAAKSRGRTLMPLAEGRLRWSMGRNGLSGITSWSGTADFEYMTEASPK